MFSMFQIYTEMFKQWFGETFATRGVEFYSEDDENEPA